MTKNTPRHRKTASSVTTSAASSAAPSRLASRAPSPFAPRQPFRFFDLPAELRNQVYENVLWMREPLDLNPLNFWQILPRLALFLVSHRMHEEAYRIFYAQPIRLFPNHGRFFHTKQPLLQRLPVRYREVINSMELRLGPGWSQPPRCQNTQPSLGLKDCVNLRRLNILIEIDPSDSVFAGFRGKNATEDTYKWFCVDLLTGILEQVPSLEVVEIDAWPCVKKDAPLVVALRRKVEENRKRLEWGRLREWAKDGEEPGLIGLEGAMAAMGISNECARTITVRA